MDIECGAREAEMWKDGGRTKARPTVAEQQQSRQRTGNAWPHRGARRHGPLHMGTGRLYGVGTRNEM